MCILKTKDILPGGPVGPGGPLGPKFDDRNDEKLIFHAQMSNS